MHILHTYSDTYTEYNAKGCRYTVDWLISTPCHISAHYYTGAYTAVFEITFGHWTFSDHFCESPNAINFVLTLCQLKEVFMAVGGCHC